MTQKYQYITGICHTGSHSVCAGEYAGVKCECPCHRNVEISAAGRQESKTQQRLF